MTNYLAVYGRGETLSLPRTNRVYFDHLAHEWNDISTNRKLLDLGYVQTFGYDIRAAIQKILDTHEYINESEIKRSLAILMSELRGCQINIVENEFKSVPLKGMIDSFLEELHTRYILPTSGNLSELVLDIPNSEHYIIPPNRKITDNDIKYANHWCQVADELNSLYSEVNTYVYPGDEEMIEKFNDTASEKTRFRINTPPFPFQGNPLTANVIILSQNPGYIPRVNEYFAKILNHYPQLSEMVMIFLRRNLRLQENRIMPRPEISLEGHPTSQDAYNMLGDWYWYDIFFKWEKDGLPIEEIASKVAIIQNIAYHSEKAKELSKGAILPSQLFIKKMIRHIACTKNTLFVVPRAVRRWENLLGPIWTLLKDEGRIIIGRNPINQHLTEKNLGTDNYRKIIDHLKNN